MVNVLVSRSNISWHDWSIIKKVKESAAVTGEYDLLFGAFNRCCELSGICLLELLTCLDHVLVMFNFWQA